MKIALAILTVGMTLCSPAYGSFIGFAKDVKVSDLNTSNTPLAASATWTGGWESDHEKGSVQFGVLTDQIGELCIDFRKTTRGKATVSGLCFDVAANINEFHTLGLAGRDWRLRFENKSTTDQTIFEPYAAVGNFTVGTAPANLTLGQDADALAVRPLDPSIEIASGKRAGWSISPKLGINPDVDTGTVPEDVTDLGGSYTGFPVGTIEKMECLSSSASDTGTLTIGGILASETSTSHISETITLNGTTPVETVTDVYRAHTMRYDSGDDTTFNIGDITCRHATTEANVFVTIAAGRSQSNYMVFTCPYEKTCWIKTIQGSIRRGTSATVDGAIWFRSLNGSPRYRRPFTIGNNAPHEPPLYGAIRVPGQADIKVTILTSSVNNVNVVFGMEIIQIND